MSFGEVSRKIGRMNSTSQTTTHTPAHLASRTLKIARATVIGDFFAMNAEDLDEVGIEPPPRKPKWWNEMLKQGGL